MSEWKFLTLKEAELEFIDGDRGINYPKKSELLLEGDCVFLNTGNVRQNSFDFSNLDFITKEKDNLLRNGKLQRDDIVLTTRGTVGNVALYSQEVPFSNIRINSGMVIIRVNKNFWHPYFVYLFFQSHLFKKQISRLISGSAQPQLPISILETVSIPQLTLDEQKEIIFNIKSIDQKIQINNQINQELETMAKTLYDYWFVQFDFPDQNGKPYKSSGGKMVYNPELKRQIPEGWGVEKLGDITICHDSKRVPLSSNDRELVKGEIPYYGATGIMDYVNNYIFEGDYVLMAEDGSVMTEKGTPILQRISGKNWVNNHAHVLEPIKNHSCKLLIMLLKDVSVMKIKTGSIQMKINQENMNKIVVPAIPLELLFEINQKLEVIDKQQLNLIEENKQLTQLRDWLLPMLMNGQVKVE
ncbi:MAG: restriction endonuclease subunit S [Streptococcus cristatus]|nr:restriction endonuclease subunit S [Streptococcus cristatus]